MPATHAGTIFRSTGAPIVDLQPPAHMSKAVQRTLLAEIAAANQQHAATRADQSELAARISSYELAYKMQDSATRAVDLSQETAETLALYGIGNKRTDDFGRRCLIARRLAERGVRFIQLYTGGAHNDDNWDAHGDLEKTTTITLAIRINPSQRADDLKRTGMLDETLVVWGGEFGRQPTAE